MHILLLVLWLLIPSLLWAQGLPLKDGNSATLADIETCGATNCVKATGPLTPAGSGFGIMSGTTGASLSDATGGRMNRAYVTESNGQKVAAPSLLWDDTFNATTQNSSKYTVTFTTQTITASAGTLRLNSAGGNAINTNAGIQTFRTFPLFAKSETRVNISAFLSQVPQANNLIEFGLFSAVLSTRVAPTDGAFFRFNTSAELRGVINFAGVETQTAAITPPSANVMHDWMIVTNTNTVVFYIDDVVVGTINLLTDAPTQGQPFQSGTQPLTMRTYIGGSAPSLGTVVQVSGVFVTVLGPDTQRLWSETKSGLGHMAYQGQNGCSGAACGTSANALNAATPAASALTNTAISTGSPVGLGGLAHVLPTLTAGADGLLFSFQNPAGSVTQTPRTLVIRGVSISGGVDVVLTGGPLVLAYSLAYGSTSASLATAETASFATATTKAPRRIWLGVQTCIAAAVAGTALSSPIVMTFASPIVVAPGEFVGIAVRNQGVVTTLGSVIITAAFDAYYE